MEEKKKSIKELKIEFTSKMKECLLRSSKLNLIKLLMEYRSDKFSNSGTEQYLGLKEMHEWSKNNFSEDKINASWMYIRGLKRTKK